MPRIQYLIINNYCNYLLSDFLRLAKNRPAAAIMIAHPAIVKIVVPMPPVSGKAESLVSVIEPLAVRVAVAFPSLSGDVICNSISLSVLLTLYPSGAFVSWK